MPRADQRPHKLILATALALACGKVTPGETTDAGVDAPLTPEQACTQEAQAICDKLDACTMVFVQYLYGDKDTCVSRLKRGCLDEQNAPGVTRTPADLGVCARDVEAAACPDLLASSYPASCLVKPGTVENGVACGTDWQCKSTYCSKKDGDCGVCGPRAALGGDCTADQGCQPGMVCGNNKCVMPAGVQAACNPPSQPCRSGLYCTANNICAATLGAGGACRSLLSPDCDIQRGYVCNGLLGGSCVQVTVAKTGEACGGSSTTICMDLGPCTGSTSTAMGVCAAPAGDGEACGSSADNRVCVPPATCTSGLCRLPTAQNCR